MGSVPEACGVLNEQQQPCLRGTAATARRGAARRRRATGPANPATTAPAGRLAVRNGRAAMPGATILRDCGIHLMGEGSVRRTTSMLFYWSTTKMTGATRSIRRREKCTTTRASTSTLLLDWLGLVKRSSVRAEVRLRETSRRATIPSAGIERHATAKRSATASRIDARHIESD